MKNGRITRFNYLFKLYRETLGLNYFQLADALGYSPLHLEFVEKGMRKPDRNLVESMIKFYELGINGKRDLYDAAAEALNSLPFDVVDYLIDNPDVVNTITREIIIKELSKTSR